MKDHIGLIEITIAEKLSKEVGVSKDDVLKIWREFFLEYVIEENVDIKALERSMDGTVDILKSLIITGQSVDEFISETKSKKGK